MGLFATGISAFGKVAGSEVKVSSDAPGPQRIKAWKPGEGRVACGMIESSGSIASKRKYKVRKGNAVEVVESRKFKKVQICDFP